MAGGLRALGNARGAVQKSIDAVGQCAGRQGFLLGGVRHAGRGPAGFIAIQCQLHRLFVDGFQQGAQRGNHVVQSGQQAAGRGVDMRSGSPSATRRIICRAARGSPPSSRFEAGQHPLDQYGSHQQADRAQHQHGVHGLPAVGYGIGLDLFGSLALALPGIQQHFAQGTPGRGFTGIQRGDGFGVLIGRQLESVFQCAAALLLQLVDLLPEFGAFGLASRALAKAMSRLSAQKPGFDGPAGCCGQE